MCACVHVRKYLCMCEGMCVCVYVCMYVCVYVCTYVCIHRPIQNSPCLYVHTCYILTNPHILSSRCKHFVFLRPNLFLHHKIANPRVPPCNDLNLFFFMKKSHNNFFFYITRQLTQGSLLVTTWNFFPSNHIVNFFKKKLLHKQLKDMTLIYNI